MLLTSIGNQVTTAKRKSFSCLFTVRVKVFIKKLDEYTFIIPLYNMYIYKRKSRLNYRFNQTLDGRAQVQLLLSLYKLQLYTFLTFS